MIEDATERFVALETRLAHHERMAEEMSDEVMRQAKIIDALVAQMGILRERLAELGQGWQRSPQDDKPPPHY